MKAELKLMYRDLKHAWRIVITISLWLALSYNFLFTLRGVFKIAMAEGGATPMLLASILVNLAVFLVFWVLFSRARVRKANIERSWHDPWA